MPAQLPDIEADRSPGTVSAFVDWTTPSSPIHSLRQGLERELVQRFIRLKTPPQGLTCSLAAFCPVDRADEIKKLTSSGVLPHEKELESHPEKSLEGRPWLMGSVAASVKSVIPAKEIVDTMYVEPDLTATRLPAAP